MEVIIVLKRKKVIFSSRAEKVEKETYRNEQAICYRVFFLAFKKALDFFVCHVTVHINLEKIYCNS